MIITCSLLCFKNQSGAVYPPILSNCMHDNHAWPFAGWLVYPRPIFFKVPCELTGVVFVDVSLIQVDLRSLQSAVRFPVGYFLPKESTSRKHDIIPFFKCGNSFPSAMDKSPSSQSTPESGDRDISLVLSDEEITERFNSNTLAKQIF